MNSFNKVFKLILMILVVFNRVPVYAQQLQFNKEIGEALSASILAGISCSFAQGEYVTYQKSFSKVTNPDTDISGKFLPLTFFTAGFEVRYTPFSDDLLSNLSIGIGLDYYQRGFINQYNAVYNDPDADVTDDTRFIEAYHINIYSVPVSIRWGRKIYAQVGFSSDHIMFGYRNHTVDHSVNGSDAYNGGFETRSKEITTVDIGLFDTKSLGWLIGGGINFSEHLGMLAEVKFSGETFTTGDNFKNITPMLALTIKL